MDTQFTIETARNFQQEIAEFLLVDFSDEDDPVCHEHRDICADNISDGVIGFLEEVKNPTLPSVVRLAEMLPELGVYDVQQAQSALTGILVA